MASESPAYSLGQSSYHYCIEYGYLDQGLEVGKGSPEDNQPQGRCKQGKMSMLHT